MGLNCMLVTEQLSDLTAKKLTIENGRIKMGAMEQSEEVWG